MSAESSNALPLSIRGRWKILATDSKGTTTEVYGPYWTRRGARRASRLPQFQGDSIQIVRSGS